MVDLDRCVACGSSLARCLAVTGLVLLVTFPVGPRLNTAGDALRWTVKVFGALLDQVVRWAQSRPGRGEIAGTSLRRFATGPFGSTTSQKDTPSNDLVAKEQLSPVDLVTTK